MAKKSVKMLSSVIVLGVLAGAYLGVKWYAEKAEEREANADTEETITVFEENYDDLKTVNLTIDGEKATFEKTDDVWLYKQDEEFPLDQSEVENMISSVCLIETTMTIDGVEDLSLYELEEPTNVLEIETVDGEVTTLSIGMKNTSTNQYYMLKNDENTTVYVVDSSYVSKLDVGLYDLAENASFPDIESTAIIDAEVIMEDNDYLLEKEDTTGFWYISSEKYEKEKADSSKGESFASSISGLGFNEFVDYNCEEDSVYGLDEPYATIVVNYQTEEVVEVEEEETEAEKITGEGIEETTEEVGEETAEGEEVTEESIEETTEEIAEEVEGETVEESTEETMEEDNDVNSEEGSTKTIVLDKQLILYVGNETESDSRYVKLDDSNEIYTISNSNLEVFLGKTIADFFDLNVSYLSINNLAELTVERNSEIHVFNVSRETSENEDGEEVTTMTYSLDKISLEDRTQFTAFYNKLINMAAQSRMTEEYVPENMPEMSVELVDLNGEKIHVDYYEYDLSFYAAVVNEKVYLINKMTVKEMLESYQALLGEENEMEDTEE